MKRCLAVAVGLVAYPVWAATYYVDYSKGSDAQAGTSEAAAWKHAPGDKNAADAARSDTSTFVAKVKP